MYIKPLYYLILLIFGISLGSASALVADESFDADQNKVAKEVEVGHAARPTGSELAEPVDDERKGRGGFLNNVAWWDDHELTELDFGVEKFYEVVERFRDIGWSAKNLNYLESAEGRERVRRCIELIKNTDQNINNKDLKEARVSNTRLRKAICIMMVAERPDIAID